MVFDDLIDRLIVAGEGKSVFLSALISTLTYVLLTHQELGILRFNYLQKILTFVGFSLHTNGYFMNVLLFGVRGLDFVLELITACILAFFLVLIVFSLFSLLIDMGHKTKKKLM